MLPPLAPVSALEIRLGLEEGDLADADLARAEAALRDVSDLVRDEAGREWLPESLPAVVLVVVIQAALRTYRNPDGYASESLGGGAYGYSYAPGATGAYLNADEKVIVARASRGRRSGSIFSLRTPSAYEAPEVAEEWSIR